MVAARRVPGYASEMAATSKNRAALAQRVWRAMFDYLMRTAPERGRVLGDRGLTPNDSRALWSLDPAAGRTMRALADAWQCDASNATWIVDRLERLGLAERRGVAHDRRVKQVVLTPKGVKLKAELLKAFHTPPADLVGLDRGSLGAMQRALEKLPRGDGGSK